MSERNDRLIEQARAWAAQDPDEQTRAELEAVVAAAERGEDTDLADRFAGTLEFGTAGLRGALGAGPNRMNRVVVTRAAAGLFDVSHMGQVTLRGGAAAAALERLVPGDLQALRPGRMPRPLCSGSR